MGKHRVLLCIAVIACMVLLSCDKHANTENNSFDVEDFFVNEGEEVILTAFSQNELMHDPYGWDSLYGSKEVPEIWWDRMPKDPQEGDIVEINLAVGENTGKTDLWVEWKLNGAEMEAVACKHVANRKAYGVMRKQYQAKLGPFVRGDKIEYRILAGERDKPRKATESYEFTVYNWEPIKDILEAGVKDNTVHIRARTESLTPALSLALLDIKTLKLRIEPKGIKPNEIEPNEIEPNEIEPKGDIDGNETALPLFCREEEGYYLFSNEALEMKVTGKPFSLSITDTVNNKLLVDITEEGLELLTDGKDVRGIRYNISAPLEDKFYGFGMKYDALNQRNKTVHTYCVNWYKDQMDKTYTPVPFYFVPDKYGFFVDSTYYSKFEIDTVRENICSVEVNTRDGKGVDSYFFFGNNTSIADGYTNIAGKPVLPPVWAFGPWISANEWNKQSEVLEQLNKTIEYDIPTSVIVIEAWSDEETFYTFNDSKFTPQGGDYKPALSDFKFGGRWPDPKAMVDQLHENGIRVLLWQIPVLKHSSSATIQSMRDQDYVISQGYVLRNKDGSPYRLPDGTWFGNSLLVDFTSEEATEWFLSKRQYLLEELGIDGFKTDGGEFVWGRDVAASDGTKGDELRNAYPDLYAQAYFDYARSYTKDAITFSRAGGSSMQQHPVCWVGDQSSTEQAFKEALLATLSASMSGIPFAAWDIAGFSGDVPSSELYQRAVAQAAFSPIMQVHSETSGDPVPSQARTPWNMAERKGNDDCFETYRYYANVRMNLLPYIYSFARYSSITGEPLMRSMAYSCPELDLNDKYLYQYMLGDSLLVAPVTDVSRKKAEVYLPEGTWYGLFDNKEYQGGEYTIDCPIDEIPVFVREGAILPMNLNAKFEFGGSIGNDTGSYKNLTFRIYPGDGYCHWYDYVNDCEVEITATADGNDILVNGMKSAFSIEIIGEKDAVKVNSEYIRGSYDPEAGITRFSID